MQSPRSSRPAASSRWSTFEQLQTRVTNEGVGILHGVQVGSEFCSKLGELVDAGEFDSADADYLRNGVTRGFDLGLDENQLKGKRVFKNYPTA